jgi:hypothetical protein
MCYDVQGIVSWRRLTSSDRDPRHDGSNVLIMQHMVPTIRLIAFGVPVEQRLLPRGSPLSGVIRRSIVRCLTIKWRIVLLRRSGWRGRGDQVPFGWRYMQECWWEVHCERMPIGSVFTRGNIGEMQNFLKKLSQRFVLNSSYICCQARNCQ